jgi:hypothetical protein
MHTPKPLRPSRIFHASLLLMFVIFVSILRSNAADTNGLVHRDNVKLLTIGNSFADNAMEILPEFANAGGKQITILKANLGGHSLAQHVSYLEAFEKDPTDPKGHPYKQLRDPRSHEKKDFSLREALESEDWDIVTIQQVSNLSFKPETYQPYAGILINYIHKYAPHAVILIHETWAYPDDYFAKFKADGLDQKTMYAGLKTAYQKLADETGLRIIPVGEAFQNARSQPMPFSLNVTGDKHANVKGKYLAAAVFYEMIFGKNVEAVPVVRKEISPDDATALRHIAHETVVARYGNNTTK